MRACLIVGAVIMAGLAGCLDETTDGTNTDGTTKVQSFACGTLTCDGDQYCQETIPGVKPDSGTASSSFSCLDAPADCNGTPTCACLSADAACASDCDESGDGVLCTIAAP